MAEARALHQAVGSGDGAWFAQADGNGRGQLRGGDGSLLRAEAQAQFSPTVFLYDNFPGGVGQSEPLWRRQSELIHRASELVGRCDCRAGCPACIGPILAAEEESEAATPKSLALRVLSLLASS
jgi:DEAD/DEAH box helicase domain-containing protein